MGEPRIVDLEALYAALDVKRRAEDLSWREAASKIGVSASTLTRMAQGAGPDVEGFAKMVRWLQLPADEFINAKTRTPKKADPLTVVVSRHLRATKELNAKNARALEGILEAALKQFKDLEDS